MAQSAPLDLGIPGLEDVMLVGRGGFAVVYRAYQPAFRRTVAVKVVSVTHVDELTRERFRRECQAMGLLSEHPSIVTVLEAGFLDDGRPFLVMAYMPEGSLQDRLRQGPLGWQEATRIGVKLAGALGTAHQAGVLHRDVKPDNVLVSQYGEPQLADFGIARVAGGQETSSGVVTASLSYAPPEIVDGQRPSVASDVYSLGATVHALMAGSAPFWKDREDSIAALLNRVMNHPPRDLREFGVPANVAGILGQAMAKDPQDRPTSAAQFGRLLRLAEDENGLRPTQLMVYKPADEPRPVTQHSEAPPTEMAPAVEGSEDFSDSPTDVVHTDEGLTATETASSVTESPETEEESTGTLDREEDAATDTTGEEVPDTPVTDPATVDLAEVPAFEPIAAEPELAPTATVAAAAGPAAPPEATVDLARKRPVEEEPEPEKVERRRNVWIIAAAVVGILAVVGGFLLTRGGDEPEAATTSTPPGTSSATSAATSPSGGEFIPPPWWAEDPVLSQAVLLDSDSHDIRNHAQVREDGASVPGRWEIGIPPNWSPDYDSGWMTIAVGEDEVDAATSASIDEKSVRRHPGKEVPVFAAVFRVSVAEPVSSFSISLASTSEPHRGFGLQEMGDGQVAAFTVRDGGPEASLELERPVLLEPDVSYDVALIAKGDGVLQSAVWPSENTSATWDEIAGTTVNLGGEWTLPEGWVAAINVWKGGSVSIDEFWAFELPAADGQMASTFDFPEWWLADPDWSRARMVDHETHDGYPFLVGDATAALWHSDPPPPTWRPTFADGLMTVATGVGESDLNGIAISSKRFWRAPTTATNEYAAVYRITVNELGDGAQIFLESGAYGSDFFRNVTLNVDGSGWVTGFWTQGEGTDVAFELDQPITLEPGASYDIALIAEGAGGFSLKLWPTGQSPPTLREVPGVEFDLREEWTFPNGWDPGMDVFTGTSISIDEYWGFELPGRGTASTSVNVGMVFDPPGRGDQAYNDAAAAGLDRAAAEMGIGVSEAEASDDGPSREELVLEQAAQSDLVFAVGWTFADAIRAAAEAYPETKFAIIDDDSVELPNVANLRIPLAEGSYLMGVAAGLKTSTLQVGFIGGSEFELIGRFEAGFVAGVQAIDPAITVDVEYISEGSDTSGFNDPVSAQSIAKSMYDRGVGVIYHAAGSSGAGLFEAAREHSEATGTKVWAIGVDFDQYVAAEEAVRPYILTSMVQRFDVAVFATIQDFLGGSFAAGPMRFDLAMDGVGYATSGGFIDDIVDELEEYKAQIKNGTIEVPDTP